MATRIKLVEVKAGDYMRLHIFPVRNYHKGRRRRHFTPSSEAQQRYNDKMTALRLADLLHANFTEADYALRLSYAGESPDVETGEREVRKLVRKLKYAYKKRGCELKYILVTEQGKNYGRVHHHLIINACEGIGRSEIERKWSGYAHTEHLRFDDSEGMEFADGGLTGLSKYVVFDKPKITPKRYSRSRNLIEPEIREIIGELTCAEAAYINETGDKSRLEELYEDYHVRTVVPSRYTDCGDENARFAAGLFCVAYLCRKERKFNCLEPKDKGPAKKPNSKRYSSGRNTPKRGRRSLR